ncbi:hypothetical protein, partial [Parafilimonas terrae]
PTLTIQKSEKKGIDFQRKFFFVNAYYSVILVFYAIKTDVEHGIGKSGVDVFQLSDINQKNK